MLISIKYLFHVKILRYLDTDVVVKSDLSELLSVNFRGHPAAAAEDCSQRMGCWAGGQWG
jgi:lipopolysaccharide biosynthesis glycosyltransferase